MDLKKVKLYNSFTAACFVLSLFFIQGCKLGAKHPSLVDAKLPKMIRIKDLFMNIKYNTNFKVSPDGEKIAWLGEKDKKTTIFFKTIDKEDTKSMNHNFVKGIIHFNNFYWAQDSRHILYPIWEEIPDQMHIYAADTENHKKVAVNLTPDKDNSYSIHRILKNDPDHIILTKFGRAQTIIKTSTVDLIKLNIEEAKIKKLKKISGQASSLSHDKAIEFIKYEPQPVTNNPGNVYSWATDLKGELRARIILKDFKNRALEVRKKGTDVWESILNWTIDEFVKIKGFSLKRNALYLLSNIGRDRIGLIEMDLETKRQKLISEDPTSDIRYAWISDINGEPVRTISYPDYQKYYLLDSGYADLFDAFNSDAKNSIYINSSDNQNRIFTVKINTSTNISWFFYNRETKEKKLLATRFSSEFMKKLSAMEPISYKSRDGLTINGYLTIPTGTTGKNLPMVLLVHGGPWNRDFWGVNRIVQFFANRGYVVLQINFRGSSGYGKSFMEAAKGEFASKMHTDLIDGVNWAVNQGIADPNKIGICGWSYGGYASLTGLAFSPDVFACGVSVNGISNLETFLKTKDVKNDDYKIWYKWQTYVGDPENPEDLEMMKAKSPFYRVKKITKPLLIVQGAKDQRVPRSEADTMVKVLRENNRDVKYILFPNESHYIRWWHNSFKMYNNIENFFGEHLGGRKIVSDTYR